MAAEKAVDVKSVRRVWQKVRRPTPDAEQVSIDVRDIGLLQPDGNELRLSELTGVQIVVLLRHRHCLLCQHHLIEVQRAHPDPRIGLVAIGFCPPDRLEAIAHHLGWTGAVLADPERNLYHQLGVGRARRRRIYTPGTLRFYAGAVVRRQKLRRPEDDTAQLGADAIMVNGTIRTLWRPASPDDRPSGSAVAAVAEAALGR